MDKRINNIATTLQRIVYFLFIYSILLILIYFLGNYQYFLEDTQYMLLILLEITTLIGVIIGFYCLSYNTIFLIQILIYKLGLNKNIFKIIINILIITANIVIFVFLKMLVAWFSSY